MSHQPRRVLVAGATGKTGRLILALLAGHAAKPIIRALVREPAQAAEFERRGFETEVADVRDGATSWADSAVRDVDVVVSALGGLPLTGNSVWRVDYEGTQRLLAAAKIARVDHYIFISMTGLRREQSLLRPISLLFYPKLLAEDAIRRSGIDYTILRPGELIDDEPPAGGSTSRSEVAEAVIAAMDRPEARNQIFELATEQRRRPGADRILGRRV